MSKYQLTKEIQKELDILNRRIDDKILRGVSYGNEAKRHKMLLAQLTRFNRHSSGKGIFARMFSGFSFA